MLSQVGSLVQDSNPFQLLLAFGGSPVPSDDVFKIFCLKFIFVIGGNVLLMQGAPSSLKARTPNSECL